MKNIMISGASRGIGRATATLFASKGFNLALCARHDGPLNDLAKSLENQYHIKVYTQAVDVRSTESLMDFCQRSQEAIGDMNVLVNNAGTFIPGQIHNEEAHVLPLMMETNLYSAYYLTREVLKPMIKNGKGHVFSICSTASIVAYPNGGSYCISKFALLGMTKVLREELKPHNIKVTAILPGPTYTSSWESSDLPEMRFMQSEEIALAIWSAFDMPGNAVVEEILMRPMEGDI